MTSLKNLVVVTGLTIEKEVAAFQNAAIIKYGRIEDQEVIEEHHKRVKDLREENAIVEPPDMDSKEARTFLERYSSR